jgi:hypothetical protein
MARWTWEPRLFVAATGVIALHVVDDNFLQPQPGTDAADHLLSGLVPLGVLLAAAAAYPRLPAGARAVCALSVGGFGLTAASEAIYYTSQGRLGGDDLTGWLCVPAGLLLLGLAVLTLWRSRRQTPSRLLRYARRVAWLVVAVVVLNLVGYPIVSAYILTHTMTATVPEPASGIGYEDVAFTTSDGLRLEGWYVPSENGAAVIVFPGRQGRQEHVRMLVRHGYGALVFDRRGEGASEGDPNLLGWGGDRDLKAAIAFLQGRPDVDPARIGGLGLSVGGELLLETAAETDGIRAVVSEGAGARSYRETNRRDVLLEVLPYYVLTGATRVFANEPVPPNLDDIVDEISPRSVFFVYGEEGQPQEIELNPIFFASAGRPKEIWGVPGAAHIKGLDAQPEEYERRVIGFFDRALP